MKRRTALKSLGATIGGLVALPAWANGWTVHSFSPPDLLSSLAEETLAELVETLIPETTTPGAKSLKVHQFVQRMIQDCYDREAQQKFQQGLTQLEALAQKAQQKPFSQCDTATRIALIQQYNDGAGKAFVGLVKGLTIRGYTNSEYYLVNIAKFNIAPGFYHGCVPVPQS